MANFEKIEITREFLDHHPNAYYIFPDNLQRAGCELSSHLRDHSHAIGFVIKKFPDNDDGSYYKPDEYSAVFFEELLKLKKIVQSRPDKTFYIAKMNGPSINKYKIWEKLVYHNFVLKLEKFDNVIFCWDDRLV